MRKSEDYRHKAEQCLRLAQATEDAKNKAFLLEIAQAWLDLAEQARAKER